MNKENLVWKKADVIIAFLCCVAWLALSLIFSWFEINSVNLSLLVTLLFNFAVVIVALVLFKAVRKGDLQAFGFRSFSEKYLDMGCSLFILAYLFNIVYGLLISVFAPDLPVQGFEFLKVLDQLSHPWIFIILGSIVIPITEEIFFRGFLFSSLFKFLGFRVAAVLSSLIFASLHFFVSAFLPIFVLSLVLSYIFYKSGSLYINIILHILLNTTSLLILWFVSSNIGV